MTTPHYAVQPTEWKTRFKVAHAATDRLVTPFYSRCVKPLTRSQAEHIAAFCEKHAPTDNPSEAAEALDRVGYQDKLSEFINRTGRVSIAAVFPI